MTNFLKMHFLLSLRWILIFLLQSIREQYAEVPRKLETELFICQQEQHAEEHVENSYRQARRKCIPTEKELEKGIIFPQMHWYNFQHINSSYSQEPLISSHSFQPQFKILFHQPQEVGFFLHCSLTFFLHVTN